MALSCHNRDRHLHGVLGLFKKNCLICALDFSQRLYDRSRVMVLGVCFASQ